MKFEQKTLKREISATKEKILARVTNGDRIFYSVQCCERVNGQILESKSYSTAIFSDALLAFENCFTWLKLADKLSKARAIGQRIRSKINKYENENDDFAPHYMIKARKKIQKFIFEHEPKQANKRDFWDCYL